jgi:hypothetical protein
MNFGLEKCARICLKRGRVQNKMHIGSTFENDIKELELRKAVQFSDTAFETNKHWQENETFVIPSVFSAVGVIPKCLTKFHHSRFTTALNNIPSRENLSVIKTT